MKTNVFALILLTQLLSLTISLKANGFIESYSLFGSEEAKTVNGPDVIDGEYYSDILAFRNQLIKDYNFMKAVNAYDIYLGSISSKQFAIQQRLKLNQKLSDNIYFDLVYINKENFELAREQFLTGLSYRLTDRMSLSFYTSLYSFKDQNDIGVSGEFTITRNHKFKIFLNSADFGFNQRNQINAQDKSRPLNLGLNGEWMNDNFEFFNYYAYINTSTEREFLDINQTYVFNERRSGFRGRIKLNSIYYLNFDLDFSQGRESLFSSNAPDPINDKIYDRTSFTTLNQLETLNWIFGYEYNYRYWKSDQGSVQHSNFLPHVWYKVKTNSKPYFPTGIDLGLETSIHSAKGNKSLRSSSDENEALNSRFNLRLIYKISENSSLNFLLSADLDDKFSWEGGGGQFNVYF